MSSERAGDMSTHDLRVWCMNWVKGLHEEDVDAPSMAHMIAEAEQLYHYITDGKVPAEAAE